MCNVKWQSVNTSQHDALWANNVHRCVLFICHHLCPHETNTKGMKKINQKATHQSADYTISFSFRCMNLQYVRWRNIISCVRPFWPFLGPSVRASVHVKCMCVCLHYLPCIPHIRAVMTWQADKPAAVGNKRLSVCVCVRVCTFFSLQPSDLCVDFY